MASIGANPETTEYSNLNEIADQILRLILKVKDNVVGDITIDNIKSSEEFKRIENILAAVRSIEVSQNTRRVMLEVQAARNLHHLYRGFNLDLQNLNLQDTIIQLRPFIEKYTPLINYFESIENTSQIQRHPI